MAANPNMHNLTTLIKRLEAATSRLEDMATAVDSSHPETVAAITSANALPSESEAAAAAIPVPAKEPLPRSIEDFDTLIEDDVKAFVIASEKIGGLVEEQSKSVLQAFEAERTYLLVATKAKKPEGQPPELMTDLHRYTSTVDEIREANRSSPLFTHLSAVSEGIVALGWIVEKRPADFVTETLAAAQYYGNKVLKDYKEKDKSHTEFIQAYYKVFKSLIAYLKEYFPTGLTWNTADGVDAVDAFKQIQSGTATPKANAPPAPGPPPPPPLPVMDKDGNLTAGGRTTSLPQGGDMTAMFDQLNQGSNVTSGLRKVDKSEMTHRNPTLRAGGIVPERSNSQNSISSSSTRGKSPMPNKKPESMRTKKPSRKELEGSKWIIENFENESGVIEVAAERNHSILISRCTKCIIKVTGKANAISIDNCTGLSIIIASLVSSLDVIKSPKIQIQTEGVVPTMILDQVDGATIYLSKDGLGTELFTSKSTMINVVLPPEDEDSGDSKECPAPEQIRTVIKNGALVSEVVEHAG